MTPREVWVRAWIAGLSLGLGALTSFASAEPRASHATTVYQRSRSFRIPFQSNPAERTKRREVQLWVSADQGWTWKPKDSTTPDRPSFTYEVPKDGEYWLAVRSVDAEGRLHPSTNDQIEPSMKVVVDTVPPVLSLAAEDRSASLASVRWEIHEEHADLDTLVFEYQVEGTKEWRAAPKQRAGWNGVAMWDAGYAEGLKVRASVSDKAGNRTETIVEIPGSSTGAPLVAANEERASADPPPRLSPSRQRAGGPVPKEHPEVGPSRVHASRSTSLVEAEDTRPAETRSPSRRFRQARAPETLVEARRDLPANEARLKGEEAADPGLSRPAAGGGPSLASNAARPELPPQADPSVGPAGLTSYIPPSAGSEAPPPPPNEIPTMRVTNPKFDLPYAIDGAGPGGPMVVEVWVTRDGGITWTRQARDPDRRSPFPIDLGGGGTFGLSLIARDNQGRGDPQPAPGDAPQVWVEVTAPDSNPETPRVSRAASLLQRVFGR